MPKKTKPVLFAQKPDALIRVTFTNTGDITVEQLPLPQPNPLPAPTATANLGDAEGLSVKFFAGVQTKSFAALMYTFEEWIDMYPLQSVEALGGRDPFVLDPVELTHTGVQPTNVDPAREVAFTATKSAAKSGGQDVVEITATKPGVSTVFTIDEERPRLSIMLFLFTEQKGYVRFEKWPAKKTGRRFTAEKYRR